MGRERSLFLAVAVSTLSIPGTALGEEWIYQSDSSEERRSAPLRFEAHLGLWIAGYDRPGSACLPLDDGNFPGPPPPTERPRQVGALRAQQVALPSTGACFSGTSTEVGLGAGGELAFHMVGPLSLTVGADFLYTQPAAEVRNQFILAIPFGVLLSPLDWSFRPMFRPKLTPILFLTDEVRDYAIGADLGFAWHVFDWGEISLLFGYEAGRSVRSFGLRFGLHPF